MRAWTCQADNVQLDGVHLIMFSSHPWVSGWCLFLFQRMIPLDPSFFGLKPLGDQFLPFWTGDLKTSARHGVDAHVDQQSCMLVVRDEKCWPSFVSQRSFVHLELHIGEGWTSGLGQRYNGPDFLLPHPFAGFTPFRFRNPRHT